MNKLNKISSMQHAECMISDQFAANKLRLNHLKVQHVIFPQLNTLAA